MIQLSLPPSPLYWVESTRDGLPILRFKERNVEVASVVRAYLAGSTFEELVQRFYSLTPDLIRQTLEYYHQHQEILDTYLAEEEKLRELDKSQSPLAEQIAKGNAVKARVEAFKKAHGWT